MVCNEKFEWDSERTLTLSWNWINLPRFLPEVVSRRTLRIVPACASAAPVQCRGVDRAHLRAGKLNAS